MITLFRRQTPSIPTDNRELRIKKFKREGEAPFQKLSFVTHQVFELNKPFTLQEKDVELFEELLLLTIPFEIWIIPSTFNVKKMTANMGKKLEDKDRFLNLVNLLMKEKNTLPIERNFLVVNRHDSVELTEKMKSLGVSFLEIPEMVAKVIKVKYEKKGENQHETITV